MHHGDKLVELRKNLLQGAIAGREQDLVRCIVVVGLDSTISSSSSGVGFWHVLVLVLLRVVNVVRLLYVQQGVDVLVAGSFPH